MNDRQPWRPPVPPKPTSAALQASTIAARNAKPALRGTNDIPSVHPTSKAVLAATVAGGVKPHGQADVNGRAPSLSPVRGRPQLTLDLESASKRLERSTTGEHQARPRTASELAARLASASSSPAGRAADAALLRPSSDKAGLTSREASASDRERSGSDSGATRQRDRPSKSPDKIDFSKTLRLATSTTGPGPGPVGLAPRFGSNAPITRASSHSARTRVHDSPLAASPPKMLVPDAVHKAVSQSPLTLQPVSTGSSDHRKHSSSLGGAMHKARVRATTSLSVPHTPITSRRTPGQSPNPARKADRIKDVNNLANAMVGASLASRGLSRAPSPGKKALIPISPRRHRSQSLHAPRGRPRPEPAPLKPLTLRPMRHTLRKQLARDDDEEDKRGRKLRLRKHPNVHHEGDRKRWRDKLTAKQRKRYEGLWAANRGLLHDLETVDHHTKKASIEDLVLNVVVRDIWERSRLPRHVLEEIWDLVAEEEDRGLSREQFVAGLWLIDQRLKGRKLPVKVSPSYAPHTDHRRKGVYKNDGQAIKTKSSALQTLIHAILNAEEDAVIDLVRQIRTCDNLEDLATSIEAGERVPDGDLVESPMDTTAYEPGEVPKFEAELSGKMGDLWLDGSVKFVGGTSNLIWMPEAGHYHQSSLSPGSATEIVRPREEAILSWTTVTQDKDLILHFMNMYFCWHYSYFTTLSKELFYRDFLTGTPSQYCSALLVNVMLALGCHFSTRPAARQNPADSETTGDHFFAEAKRLLYQDDEFANAKLCTVQALALMSVREAGCGRESKGWVYSGMSFRMAFDLGLNIDPQPINQSSRLSAEDIDARRITFWGCFLFDKCWSSYLGRQPQIQMANVTVRKPEVFPSEDSEMWSPYTDSGIIQANAQPARTRAVAIQISKLAEISGDLLTSFYNPQVLEKPLNKQVELKKLSDIHTRLEAWKRDLPPELEVKDSQLPQEDAWNTHQARLGSMTGSSRKPNANAAKLFGGIESLIEDSQDWWHMDQSQLALGFGNWNAPKAGVDGRPDAEREADPDAMDVDSNNQIFIPGRSVLQPGQTLSPDPSTYEMLHVMSTTWPCLSFDIVRDNLGQDRKSYPRTVYAVAGTQAETARAKNNELYVLKLSSFTTNRIRAFQLPSADPSAIATTLTATWLESGQVVVHDITPHLHSLSTPGFVLPPNASNPLSTLRMHRTEGYALDWAPSALWPHGRLLSGDNDGQIFMTQRTEGGGFATDQRPFTQHTGSIEELQWSPTERTVFASASSDGTVKVWDTRSKSRKAAVDVHISNSDVNVMSWSHQTAHLLATGCDDGQWAVWDLRQWRPQPGPNRDTPQAQSSGRLRPSPVASFGFHKKPITSIEWHPTDDSVVGVASADGTVTLWDLSVELDDEEYGKEAGMILEGSERVPPQLLFIHSAEDVKELHWHPQMPGTVMSTGGTGFGVFKTISV
ncbi:hypothetical protein DV735_g1326, partial [Chaetothyriales sp. CBS 134920]